MGGAGTRVEVNICVGSFSVDRCGFVRVNKHIQEGSFGCFSHFIVFLN